MNSTQIVQSTDAMRLPNTKCDGSPFSEETIRLVWEKAQKFLLKKEPDSVPLVLDESHPYRIDICGSMISFEHYGDTNSQFGWEIDHIIPVSEGGTDQIDNLQPLQWKTNRQKGDKLDWRCSHN